jgi:hypothetical protein
MNKGRFSALTHRRVRAGLLAATTMAASLCAFAASDPDSTATTSDTVTVVSKANTHITYKFSLTAYQTAVFELPNEKGLPVHLMGTLLLNDGMSIPGPSSQVQAVISYDSSAQRMVWLGENADGTTAADLGSGALPFGTVASWGISLGSITGVEGFDSPGRKQLTLTGGEYCSSACTYYVTMDY